MANAHERSLPQPLGRWGCLLGAALLASPLNGRAEPVELSFGVASATVVRGVAFGEGAFDAHAVASLSGRSGWRATAGVTALHAKAEPGRWDAQLFWRLGCARRLDDDWSAQTVLASYTYPGSPRLRSYARHDITATLAWRDRLYLTISGHRPDGSAGRRSTAGDIVARHALPGSLSASAGLGRLHEPRFAYSYGHLALDRRWGAAQLQLAYIATDADAKANLGPAAANRWTPAVQPKRQTGAYLSVQVAF